MNYTVIGCDDMLHIVDEDAFPVYRLDKESLQMLSFNDDANCSACVFRLASSGMLPMQVLYKVAAYIQKHFPRLNIDWFTTFYHVEKNSYLSLSFRMKEWLENNYTDSNDVRCERFLAFEETEPVENLDSVLLKIVMMNIINFDVKMR